MKRVAVIQSNYIPWRGYFDVIDCVDLFIFYDDVQYTKNDWRNRNRIKTERGTKWLTVPCGTNLNRLIQDVRIDMTDWQSDHFRRLEASYERAPHWAFIAPLLEDVYLKQRWSHLSELNQHVIKRIATEVFGSRATFDDSRNYTLRGRKEARVLDLLGQVGTTHYLTGPSAKQYLNPRNFAAAGITLEFIDYHYAPYPQIHPPYDGAVSIIDLIAHMGPSAPAGLAHQFHVEAA